jgi:hypothetical protein
MKEDFVKSQQEGSPYLSLCRSGLLAGTGIHKASRGGKMVDQQLVVVLNAK